MYITIIIHVYNYNIYINYSKCNLTDNDDVICIYTVYIYIYIYIYKCTNYMANKITVDTAHIIPPTKTRLGFFSTKCSSC